MKKIKNITAISFLLLLLATMLIPSACVKEEDFNSDTSLNLNFSADTITFDTIFTTLGSVTKQVRIYNPSDKAVKITSITLGGGTASSFRLNVDGDTSHTVSSVEIGANDYIYVFVTATINPNNKNNPFLVRDSIVFSFNNKQQYLQLTAFGQNAIYHYSPTGTSIADCSQPWTADLPHVIYGDCIVEAGNTLTIEEGARLYFNTKASLKIKAGGTLKINGAASNPVIFTGMRSDAQYKNLGGQWNSIHLEAGSVNNIINWATIRNGTTGVQVDSTANSTLTLKITNTIIENMSEAGIVANAAHIYGDNLLINNCQYYTVALAGGSYQFYQCTFANYWNVTSRKTPGLYLTNFLSTDSLPAALDDATFGNCIIYGSMQEELSIVTKGTATFNYLFDHCSLRTQKPTSDGQYFNGCQINKDPLFDSIAGYNYHLKPNSPAATKRANVGNPYYSTLVPEDLDNKERNTTDPALGAYEVKLNK